LDWAEWARAIEPILWCGGPEGPFAQLFAPGATYQDPVNATTSDLASIEAMTRGAYPDWGQQISAIHGDDSGAAFEWVGRGNLGGSTPMEIHGCTVVDIDRLGRVTRWRDYFDVKEIEGHLGTTMETLGGHPEAGSAPTRGDTRS
jgi:limonene-1,2-epoxide hydrolase